MQSNQIASAQHSRPLQPSSLSSVDSVSVTYYSLSQWPWCFRPLYCCLLQSPPGLLPLRYSFFVLFYLGCLSSPHYFTKLLSYVLSDFSLLYSTHRMQFEVWFDGRCPVSLQQIFVFASLFCFKHATLNKPFYIPKYFISAFQIHAMPTFCDY